MSAKRRASPAEVRRALLVVFAGGGGVMFFGIAETLRWFPTWVALAGVIASVSLIVVCGVLSNRRAASRED